MICDCFGPLKLSKTQLKQRNKTQLEADELQAIIYKDIDGLTMAQASTEMGISKTVFAGIYATARKKIATTIVGNDILLLPSKEDSKQQ